MRYQERMKRRTDEPMRARKASKMNSVQTKMNKAKCKEQST
jgi:hypothetical protein